LKLDTPVGVFYPHCLCVSEQDNVIAIERMFETVCFIVKKGSKFLSIGIVLEIAIDDSELLYFRISTRRTGMPPL
jgi:hypothetical protein